MNQREMVKLSKRMSLALRHAPERFGLALDEGGWVPVDDLLAALRITRRDLDAVVASNDKRRFAIDRDPGGTERRAGTTIVLTVDAEAMARDGHTFYRSANGVWLTDEVPPRYLDGA